MECRNCGKKRLKNLQAIRAHLRFCPNRDPETPTDTRAGTNGSKRLSADARRLLVPYTAIPLLEGPGIANLEETALAIGIPSRAARIAANYVAANGDLNDALSMWDLLRDCYEIEPGEKRKLLLTWSNTRGVPLQDWQIDQMGWRDECDVV